MLITTFTLIELLALLAVMLLPALSVSSSAIQATLTSVIALNLKTSIPLELAQARSSQRNVPAPSVSINKIYLTLTFKTRLTYDVIVLTGGDRLVAPDRFALLKGTITVLRRFQTETKRRMAGWNKNS